MNSTQVCEKRKIAVTIGIDQARQYPHMTDSIEKLAEKIGLDPTKLADTVARYRMTVQKGAVQENQPNLPPQRQADV